ncbi:MAG: hypothetical protein HY868_04770 [Chloroflexi bacterium]|nr:hypothetical protein [Chloroflexota bacterium]
MRQLTITRRHIVRASTLLAAILIVGIAARVEPIQVAHAQIDLEALSKTCAARIDQEAVTAVLYHFESPVAPPNWNAYGVSDSDQTDCRNWAYTEIANPLGKSFAIIPATTFVPNATQPPGGNCEHHHLNYSVFGKRTDQSNWEYIGGGGMAPEYIEFPSPAYCSGPTVTSGSHSYTGFLWGTNEVVIQNSPYKRVVVALQAPSHGVSGCGFFGCYHQVKMTVTFSPLDVFNRQEGGLGSNWIGTGKSGYHIADNRIEVNSGGPVIWNPTIFGSNQGASFTFINVDLNGVHQSLLLKVQGGGWRTGVIAVFYNAITKQIGIETFVPTKGWNTVRTFSRTLNDGDQLGARAGRNGIVDVYVNGRGIGFGRVDSFFDNKGGRVGLWFIDAGNALLDDFAGATIAP